MVCTDDQEVCCGQCIEQLRKPLIEALDFLRSIGHRLRRDRIRRRQSLETRPALRSPGRFSYYSPRGRWHRVCFLPSGWTAIEIEVGAMDCGFEIQGILQMDFLVRAGADVDLAHLEMRSTP